MSHFVIQTVGTAGDPVLSELGREGLDCSEPRKSIVIVHSCRQRTKQPACQRSHAAFYLLLARGVLLWRPLCGRKTSCRQPRAKTREFVASPRQLVGSAGQVAESNYKFLS